MQVANEANNFGYGYSQPTTSTPAGAREESLLMEIGSATTTAPPVESLDNSGEMTSSGEELQSMLGVESTSVATPTATSSSSSSSSSKLEKSDLKASTLRIEQRKEEIKRPAQRFKAAIRTKHSFEYRPVHLNQLQESIEPKIIEVDAKSIPLEIHFKSASSRIKLVQSHRSGELNAVERTSTEEEPQRLVHLVRKPIIQEVREIITPYRRIVQEIHPVQEEIRTVISHEQKRHHSTDASLSKTNERLNKPVLVAPVRPPKPSTFPEFESNQGRNEFVGPKPPPEANLQQQPLNDYSSPSPVFQQQSYSYGQAEQPPTVPVPEPVTPAAPEARSPAEPNQERELEDSSIELLNGNELESIVPARVVQAMLSEYGGQQQQQSAQQNQPQFQQINQHQLEQKQIQLEPQNLNQQFQKLEGNHYYQPTGNLARPIRPKEMPVIQPRPLPFNQFRHGNKSPAPQRNSQRVYQSNRPFGKDLRSAASNQNWRAIRPYVFYEGARNRRQFQDHFRRHFH